MGGGVGGKGKMTWLCAMGSKLHNNVSVHLVIKEPEATVSH